MKFVKIPALLSLLMGSTVCGNAENPKSLITQGDLRPLIGGEWKGTLTYLNYQPPYESVSLEVALRAELIKGQYHLNFMYPQEPHANDKTVFEIRQEGRFLNDQRVTLRTAYEDTGVQFSTAFPCQDNGMEADCRVDYTITESVFVFSKSVSIAGEPSFVRNTYRFTR